MIFMECSVPKKISDFKRFGDMFGHLLRKCKKTPQMFLKKQRVVVFGSSSGLHSVALFFFGFVGRNIDLLAEVFHRI